MKGLKCRASDARGFRKYSEIISSSLEDEKMGNPAQFPILFFSFPTVICLFLVFPPFRYERHISCLGFSSSGV